MAKPSGVHLLVSNSGMIFSTLEKGGSKCLSVWLADRGCPIFLTSLSQIQSWKVKAQNI